MRILASQTRLDDVKVDGVVELIGSSPSNRDGLLGVTSEVHNRRGTGSSDIRTLGNLIGGFALVLGGECLDYHTVVGVGS